MNPGLLLVPSQSSGRVATWRSVSRYNMIIIMKQHSGCWVLTSGACSSRVMRDSSSRTRSSLLSWPSERMSATQAEGTCGMSSKRPWGPLTTHSLTFPYCGQQVQATICVQSLQEALQAQRGRVVQLKQHGTTCHLDWSPCIVLVVQSSAWRVKAPRSQTWLKTKILNHTHSDQHRLLFYASSGSWVIVLDQSVSYWSSLTGTQSLNLTVNPAAAAAAAAIQPSVWNCFQSESTVLTDPPPNTQRCLDLIPLEPQQTSDLTGRSTVRQSISPWIDMEKRTQAHVPRGWGGGTTGAPRRCSPSCTAAGRSVRWRRSGGFISRQQTTETWLVQAGRQAGCGLTSRNLAVVDLPGASSSPPLPPVSGLYRPAPGLYDPDTVDTHMAAERRSADTLKWCCTTICNTQTH